MPTPSKVWLLIGVLALISTIAKSDGIGPGSFGQNTFGGIGQGKTSGTPGGCSGVIDLSTGCTLPIALGLVP